MRLTRMLDLTTHSPGNRTSRDKSVRLMNPRNDPQAKLCDLVGRFSKLSPIFDIEGNVGKGLKGIYALLVQIMFACFTNARPA